jgi:cell division protein FtsB
MIVKNLYIIKNYILNMIFLYLIIIVIVAIFLTLIIFWAIFYLLGIKDERQIKQLKLNN